MRIRISRSFAKRGERDDRILSLYLASYFLLTSLNIAVKVYFDLSGSVSSALSNLVMAGLILGFVRAFRIIVKRSLSMFVVWETIAVCFYFFSFVLGNYLSTPGLLTYFLWTVGICIPLGIAAYSIYDKETLLYYLTISNMIVVLPLCMALLSLGGIGRMEYSLSCAYSLLMPTLILFYQYFENRKRFCLAVGAACTVIILLRGNRGALLCIFSYLFLKGFFLSKSTVSRILFSALLLLGLYLFVLNKAAGISLLNAIAGAAGIKSRTLRTITSESFLESSTREQMWRISLQEALKKPILGWGVMGGWTAFGIYPHNIIVEFLLSFGLFLGTFFSTYYLSLYVRLFFCRDSLYRELLLFFATSCISLFTSGTFLNTPKVFIFVLLFMGRKRSSAFAGMHRSQQKQ